MFLGFLLAILLGVTAGTLTGLIPGLHINLISVLIVSLAGKLTDLKIEYAAATIISMAITHTFLDSIPSVFLGVPDPDKVAVALPMHRMAYEGEAHQAVMLTVFGSLMSILACIITFPVFIELFKWLQDSVKSYTGYVLLILTALLIIQDKSKSKAALVFVASGILGYLTLNLPALEEPLLPLLSGLFGVSTLVLSIKTGSKLPEQKISDIDIQRKPKYKSVASAVIAGAAGSFLPGMGPSQIAILGSRLFRGLGEKGYIILVGGLNTANMALSIAMLYSVNKARNGAIVALSQITSIDFKQTVLLYTIGLIASGIATLEAIALSRKAANTITKLDPKKINLAIIAFIAILATVFSGWIGIIVLVTATALGITCNYLEVGKNHLMGCLLIPVMIYFLVQR